MTSAGTALSGRVERSPTVAGMFRGWREARLYGLATAFACGTGIAAASGGRPLYAALGLGCLLVLAALPTTATLLLVVYAFVLPLTLLNVPDTRLAVPALLVPMAVKLVSGRRQLTVGPLVTCLVPLFALACASLSWTDDRDQTLFAVLALFALMAVLLTVPAVADRRQLWGVLRIAALLLVVVSLVLAVTPYGVYAGRLRGAFGNANNLSLFLLLALPLFARGRWRLLIPVVLVMSAATASRAGFLGAAIAVGFFVLGRRGASKTFRGLLLVATAAALVLLLQSLTPVQQVAGPYQTGAAATTGVLRQENSRQEVWSSAVSNWRERPILGHGFGASKLETGSSLLKILVDLGLLGLVLCMPFLVMVVRIILTTDDVVVFAVTAGAAVNALFEAWMLTAGSAFFLLFCLLLLHRDVLPPAPAGGRAVDA